MQREKEKTKSLIHINATRDCSLCPSVLKQLRPIRWRCEHRRLS
jgi:hypothetical protein